ncbi:MAG: ISAzo13 family transposase [Solobacterium sp.]|nr:ISAzo13 family transposase [Solobacterium sp.]
MSVSTETKNAVTELITIMTPVLNEKQKRILYGAAAKVLGHGGVTAVQKSVGPAKETIIAGKKEIEKIQGSESSDLPEGRIRRPGGGRKKAKDKNPLLYDYIEEIIEESTYGSPVNILKWTTLSLRDIAEQVKEKFDIEISHNIVSRALEELGYSKQQNQKNLQVGEPHPDRNAQFCFINNKAQEFIEAGDPVISVDTKKKELIGNFKNNGSEYRRERDPRQVLDHDFALPELGKVAPYGVYVLNDNTGFVNLGTDHDTSEFAAESICRWWFTVGKNTFPNAKRIYINSDGGGSNRPRGLQWKYQLQQIADITGLEIHMSHFPPGTSKWNKVEHRLFCYITKNWQGKPLIDIETVVNLISSTTTKKGLKVKCVLDTNKYELKQKITDEQADTINLEECDQFGKWNYIILPAKG